MAAEQDRKKELGQFLRHRRERLSPDATGFPAGGRRRTAGLRREEVAVLAGVSTTWYTYLEQGRNVNASPAVLESIATVLKLTDDERRYMIFLAYGEVEPELSAEPEFPVRTTLIKIASIADDYPYPVYLLELSCDIIAWNSAAAEWYDDWEKLPAEDRNFILWLFTSPRARESIVDWEEQCTNIVARWRTDLARHRNLHHIEKRISEITKTSPDFIRCWEAHEVSEHRGATRRLRHPLSGVKKMHILPVRSFYPNEPTLFYHFPID